MKLRYTLYICAGLLATAASVPADIVWSGEQNLSGYEHKIDLNNDSLTDVFIVYQVTGNNDLLATASGYINARIDGANVDGSNKILVDSMTGYHAAVPFGTLISSSPIPNLEWEGDRYFSGLVSEWTTQPPTPDSKWRGLLGENRNTYVGIAFDVDEATHYGWINIALGDEDPVFGFENPIIQSWAYESTPDTPIMAGAIPEPSTGILTLLGSLCMLLTARARRRRTKGCSSMPAFRMHSTSFPSEER